MNFCCIVIKQLTFVVLCLIVLCLLLVIFSFSFFAFGGASLLTIHANKLVCFHPAKDALSLIFTWVSGLLLGYLFCKPCFVSLMRSALLQPVSIVGLFICIFLPLILSYFSILLKKPIIILVVCFIKSIAYGFSYGLLALLYSEASWLLRSLFLFSDSCMLLILVTLWLNLYSADRKRIYRAFRLATAVAGFVAILDYCVVSHFLESLL